jgi:DNA modification methylase
MILSSQVVQVPTGDLKPHPKNPRKGNVGVIADSIRANGFYGAVVAQKSTGHILAGNHRWRAAQEAGMPDVPVLWVDVDDERALRILLADNRTSDVATNDPAVLAELLAGLPDLTGTGYQPDDLKSLLDGISPPEPMQDEVPPVPDQPVTVLGDLWQLGNHRLMCGSCTDSHSVARLFDGEKAQMLFTSPPYALGASVKLSGNKSMSKRQNAYDDYDDKSVDWPRLMEDWWQTNHPYVSDVHLVNVQMLAGNKRALVEWMHNRREHLVDVITWDKGHAAPQMASGVLTNQFEWIIVLGKSDAPRTIPLSSWHGSVSNVYAAGPQRSNEYSDKHAATMPIHLPMWAMTKLCDKTKSVYDPFMGTGTTLIAAESIGVRSYGMELSPAYCDVIIRRWETMTGKQAVRIDA